MPLKERTEKLKREFDQQLEAQIKTTAATEASKAAEAQVPALTLSREEVQLLREYIKPAPSAGTAEPALNVGDPVGSATIPLPSQLMDKIPKLLGARFTTRNGAIIITGNNSRRADAVVGPN